MSGLQPDAGNELYYNLQQAFSLSDAEERGARVRGLIIPALELADHLNMVVHPLDFDCAPVYRSPDGSIGVCLHLRDVPHDVDPDAPDLQRHNHPWDLTAGIVMGSLGNVMLTLARAKSGQAQAYLPVRAENRNGVDSLEVLEGMVAVVAEETTWHYANDVYSMRAGEFHLSAQPTPEERPGEIPAATVVLSRSRPSVVPIGLLAAEQSDLVSARPTVPRQLLTVDETRSRVWRFVNTLTGY